MSEAAEQTRGERVIAWIHEHLTVPEGRLYGKPVRLLPWQQDEIRKIYDNPAGTRTAILSFGRKNGKTALAAMLLLVHLCGPEALPNSGLYSAARSKDQAALTFKYAAKMIKLSPALSAFVGIRDRAKELYCPELGTEYIALSADAKTKFGLSPVFIIHDELGQVRGPTDDLYTALETATGAQASPLSIIISTQAARDADLLSTLIDDALKGEDPHTVLGLYTASTYKIEADGRVAWTVDGYKDPFALETIKAANPGYGVLQNPTEVQGQARKAQRLPALEADFRNLILNQRVEVRSVFVTRATWELNGDAVVPKFKGDCWLGYDLSEVNDLTAAVLLTIEQDKWQVRPYFFLPEEGIKERSQNDRVPYDLWAESGYITLVPGKTVSYAYVAAWTIGIFKSHKILAAGFDRYNWRHFKPWLEQDGKPRLTQKQLEKFQEFGQGYASMSPALRTMETDLLTGGFAHGNHPVLAMCASNAVVIRDAAGNRKLDKSESRGRIDGIIALTMARAMAELFPSKGKSAGIKFL